MKSRLLLLGALALMMVFPFETVAQVEKNLPSGGNVTKRGRRKFMHG